MVAKLSVRYPDFGRRLRDRALEKQLTVADIQRGLKVTYEMARRYWHGIAMPRGPRLKKLSDLLDSRVAWLEHGEPDRASVGARAAGENGAQYAVGLSEDAIEIARAWDQLSEARKEIYRSLIFYDAVISRVMPPWFKMGTPTSKRYGDLMRSIERDMEDNKRQLRLKLET
jgi:transcriptional regulator with XRE-family HTH domain